MVQTCIIGYVESLKEYAEITANLILVVACVCDRISKNPPSSTPALVHGEFENLCFVSVVPVVCMSRSFGCSSTVDLNKIAVISS